MCINVEGMITFLSMQDRRVTSTLWRIVRACMRK